MTFSADYSLCRLKKIAQCESCKLSFIWGQMRTRAQEAVSQIALWLVYIYDFSEAGIRAIKHPSQ